MVDEIARPGRRRLSPGARRALIVSAAVRYFAEVGFDGPTRELARRAGVTQPLLYKYFPSKAALMEAVFEHVYLGRLSPQWPVLLADRRRPLRDRLIAFYREYTTAIFTYEWMRMFMFAGLAGEPLNRRYLEHLRDLLLSTLLVEMQQRATGPRPEMEDIWNLHGSIVYLGIRKFIYQLPVPDDIGPTVEHSIDRFLAGFGLE